MEREQENLPEEGKVGVSHPNFQTAQFPLFSFTFLFSLSSPPKDEIAIQANKNWEPKNQRTENQETRQRKRK